MKRFALLFGLIIWSWASTGLTKESDEQDVVLQIKNVKTTKGIIRCGLYTKANWLEAENAVKWVDAEYTKAGRAVCHFQNTKPGIYGIGTFHDEDADHDMDSNFMGIPSEGVCASNDPGATMGPPEFDGAKFRHSRKEDTEVTCTMRY